MSDEAKKPPAFYCPSCGQKHRANLDSLVGKAGALMRLACVGCATPLAVTLDDDDKPVCTLDEPKPEAEAEAKSETKDEKAFKAPVPKKKRAKGDAPVPRSKRKKKTETGEEAKAETKDSEEAEAEKPAEPRAEPPQDEEAPAPDDATEDAASDPPDTPAVEDAEFGDGDHVGRYAIEGAIGKGGTSTVYKAFDPTTNRSVALKVLNEGANETMRSRFLREIEVQANIRHQNIMPVFDRGELEDGRPFFTMELLYSPWTLAEIVQRREEGRLARYTTLKKLEDLETLVREIFVPIADGVYVANVENGVIHRDLKPDNVLVDSRTLRPYVIDFGICHVLERKAGLASKSVIPPTTEDEGIVGTPRFLAPEQVKGSAHARTDVWGLGATLHYMAAGEPPLASSTPISRVELKRRIAALKETKQVAIDAGDERKIDMCEEKLVRLTDSNLRTIDDLFTDARDGNYTDLPSSTPSPLKAVIKKALAVQTSERYVNARQLNSDLQAWLGGTKVRALSQAGGKAAAVESARRAVRTHLVTALWLIAGLAGGIGLAKATSTPGDAPPSTRLADAEEDINLLAESLEGLDRVKDSLTAVERHRLWSSLDSRAGQIDGRLKDEPQVAQVQAVRERLAYVRGRFAAPRVRLEFPEGTNFSAKSLVTGRAVKLVNGENELAPGSYEVQVGESIRFPLQVPLVVRKQQDDPNKEPALAALSLPIDPAKVPTGMVLVLGGRILPRDLPFNPPSTSAVDVAPFLLDDAEVTNAEYVRFLASLSLEERKARAPTVAFVPDSANQGAPVVVKGREDAPVVGIRAEDAMAYAKWRSEAARATVRLPTEAEWVLAAGAGLGYSMPGGKRGYLTDAEFASPLREAGAHAEDIGPFGAKGMLGNAREMVTAYANDLDEGAVLVKGAGVGDDPDQGAIYIHRVLPKGERHTTTGFRCVREISGAGPR